jgi:predicted outer membrane repeat protein
VKQGVYLLTQQIEVNKDLALYGGFNGSEHYLSQRDFINNTVYVDGQGLVRCFSLSGAASTVIIDGFCIQNGSSPTGPGGGIYNSLPISLSITHCTFRNNHAYLGGAIKNCNNASQLKVVDCMFEGNSASSEQTGGGIYSMSANTEISRCVFNGNTAGGGGGISCTGPKICISNSLFNGNSAYSPSYGTRGGGIRIWNSGDAAITNCTVYGNQASYKGGGIYCENSTVSVWNSIVWGNSWGAYNKQIFPLSSTVTVDYCDVELGAGETPWGGHCIDEDPAFIDPVNGDFHLSEVSPCINKGFNEAPCILDTDLEGNPRIIGSIVDMGAYEFGY